MATTTTALPKAPASNASPQPAERRRPRLAPSWFLVSPSVALLLLWMLVPLAMTLYFSLVRYNLLYPGEKEFVGLENFHYFLTDAGFIPGMTNTLILVGSVLLISVVLGVLISALLEAADFAGRGIVRVLLISPFFIMPTVSALLVLFLMVGLGAVGFADDYIKISKQRSLGLRSHEKLIGQTAVAVLFAVLALQFPNDALRRPASTSSSMLACMGPGCKTLTGLPYCSMSEWQASGSASSSSDQSKRFGSSGGRPWTRSGCCIAAALTRSAQRSMTSCSVRLSVSWPRMSPSFMRPAAARCSWPTSVPSGVTCRAFVSA